MNLYGRLDIYSKHKDLRFVWAHLEQQGGNSVIAEIAIHCISLKCQLFYRRILQHGEGGLYRTSVYSYEFEEARQAPAWVGPRMKVNEDFHRSYTWNEIWIFLVLEYPDNFTGSSLVSYALTHTDAWKKMSTSSCVEGMWDKRASFFAEMSVLPLKLGLW